jgi:hypothetical protein
MGRIYEAEGDAGLFTQSRRGAAQILRGAYAVSVSNVSISTITRITRLMPLRMRP